MTETGTRRRGALLVIAAAVLWASLGWFTTRLYDAGYTVVETASLRTIIAWVGLALYMIARRSPIRIRIRDLPFYIVYGVLAFALFELLYFAALARAPIAVAAALLYTAPAFVLAISVLLGDERLDRRRLVILALVLCGVGLVTGAARGMVSGEYHVSVAAAGIGLAAAFTYALYTVFSKHGLRRYDPARNTFWAFAFASLALAAAAPPWSAIGSGEALPWLIGIGLLPTLLAYLCYLEGLRHMPAGTASMLASVEPVVATLIGYVVLGQDIGIDQMAGIGLIVGSATMLAASG